MSKSPVKSPLPPATAKQLDLVARHLIEIRKRDQPRPSRRRPDPDIVRRTGTTLVDLMHGQGMIDPVLHSAAERYRQLWWEAQEPSAGVATYGSDTEGYSHRSTSREVGSDLRRKAMDALKSATVAAFGTVGDDGKQWRVDEVLMQTVIPALLSTDKSTTQATIGRDRSPYTGRAQVGAAGGTIVVEVLNRLALHFGYRRR